ncbi:hypothetical protein WJX72_003925 [[Myrmecia] bisecta]|uniref:Uncharacterized protein n=1 Tax=[Myrmecia] bisecta TaxID=41462 RepID=A0AAW1QAC2_9CHLO
MMPQIASTEDCAALPATVRLPCRQEGAGKSGQERAGKSVQPLFPVWHRKGCHCKHSTPLTHSTPALAVLDARTSRPDKYNCKQSVYVRHHTHTHTYSKAQSHGIRTVLQMPWVAGMNGNPPATQNYDAFCSELQEQLFNINNTLTAVQAKSEASRNCPLLNDTVSLRRAVNDSLYTQMEFFTACVGSWCYLPEAVAQKPMPPLPDHIHDD